MSDGGYTSLLIFLLPLLLIGWMILSQRKRQKEIVALQDSLAVGDEVVTTSGLYGRITALDATAVTLEVSPGVQVRYDRRAVGMKAQVAPQAPAVEPGE